ncbi:AAA family ATPase [Rouxiella badensis]|uniref:AAA family ATPase n=1 Tax=Rouxiella badensis TaxID=1646377 RepID=UPI00301BC7FE
MYISEIRIENFRLFGSTEKAFVLPLNPGLTALVGENDAGKTAVIDAIRLVLGTRDQDFCVLTRMIFTKPHRTLNARTR